MTASRTSFRIREVRYKERALRANIVDSRVSNTLSPATIAISDASSTIASRKVSSWPARSVRSISKHRRSFRFTLISPSVKMIQFQTEKRNAEEITYLNPLKL